MRRRVVKELTCRVIATALGSHHDAAMINFSVPKLSEGDDTFREKCLPVEGGVNLSSRLATSKHPLKTDALQVQGVVAAQR